MIAVKKNRVNRSSRAQVMDETKMTTDGSQKRMRVKMKKIEIFSPYSAR